MTSTSRRAVLYTVHARYLQAVFRVGIVAEVSVKREWMKTATFTQMRHGHGRLSKHYVIDW